jgi:hypothetical protein
MSISVRTPKPSFANSARTLSTAASNERMTSVPNPYGFTCDMPRSPLPSRSSYLPRATACTGAAFGMYWEYRRPTISLL